MKPSQKLAPEFVEFIPSQVEDGKLYVSMEYATIVHNCCCGCGNKVVTPLTPTDWKITFDGESVSVSPSIGNWSFPCKSHYWIRRGGIEWSGKWTPDEIASGRQRDQKAKKKHFAKPSESTPTPPTVAEDIITPPVSTTWWSSLKQRIYSWFK